MAAAHVKGGALREFLIWYERERDIAPVAARLAHDERRGELQLDRPVFGMIASRWYPIESVAAVLDAVTADLDESAREELAQVGSAAALDQAIRGIYRFAFQKLVSPERYARHIQRLWRQLHDTGLREVRVVENGHAISTVREWTGHHPFLCTLTVATMAAAFETMGCMDVSTLHEACVSWGDLECRTTVRWAV